MTNTVQAITKRRTPRTCATIGLAALLMWLAGIASAADIIGSGTWSSSGRQASGTWQLVAAKADTILTGTLNTTNMPDFTQGTVAGSFKSTGEIEFGVVYNSVEEATFTGALTGAGASGTYTTKNGDAGNWSGSFAVSQ